MKRFFFLITIFLVSKVGFGQHLNIYPTTLQFSINNTSTSETQTINITNNSEKSQVIELYLGDWNRNENGTHSYFDAGTKPYSCAEWITLNTKFLNIAPKETAQVIITMQSPESEEAMEAMKWTMLYIQGSEFREKVEEISVGVQTKINEIMRFGIHIYQTPAHLKLAEVKALTMDQSDEEPDVFNMRVENTGFVMVRTKTYLELTNINTGEEFKSETEECPIFPLGKRVVSLHLPKDLPKGQYSMLGILDYGNPNSLEAIEQVIEIK